MPITFRATLFAGLATAFLLLATVPVASAATAPMRFGMDLESLQGQVDLGVGPDYAQYWAGVWNEDAGWAYLGTNADKAADKGAVPVIEWWYWGDDITKSCVQNGCWSGLHDAWKSKANWAADAGKLADALHSGLQGRKGIVVIESEFNKGDIQTWEDFDGLLQAHAKIFRDRAPEVQLALGFGNWGSDNWWRFDRAAGAMDLVGFQTMRGSTKDSLGTYKGAVDAVKAATSKLQATFGKPVLLHDLALSSYGSGYEGYQRDVLKSLFDRRGELQDAGLTGVIYRGLKDNPGMDPANYYGQAEKYWGLKRADGSAKPAQQVWVDGVKAARAAASPFTATFAPQSVGNDWWVEAKVSSAQAVTKVEAKVGTGAWQNLPKQNWGHWAASIHAPDGSPVQFRATNGAGQQVLSGLTTWGAAPAPAFDATFEPKSVGNDWWVEAKVGGNQAPTKVEAKVGTGAWTSLPKTDWGTWAASLHAPGGSKVQFRAWAGGASDLSATYTW